MSDQPIGYILMENDTTFRDISDLKVFNDNHLFYVRFVSTLQSLNRFNRNNKFYTSDAIVQSLSTEEINELIANNKFKGEAGHPIGEKIERIAVVDPKLTCHRIVKWWVENDLIRGIVETLDDGMYGTKLTKAILQNENPSFSYRGLAMLQKKGTKAYIRTPPRTIAYDEVNLPSHKEAYGDPKKTKIAQSYSGTVSASMESVDMSREITGSEIADLFQRKSETLQIVCESFGIDPSNVSLVGNKIALRNGDERYMLNMEANLAKEVAYYWGTV